MSSYNALNQIMKLLSLLFSFFILQASHFFCVAQTIRYVVAGASGDGSSWPNASGDLQLMINQSSSLTGDSILVASGIYIPNRSPDGIDVITVNSRDNSFLLKKDVKILGGFPVGGGVRNWQANQTILSGDAGVKGNYADNVYHVVIAAGNLGSALLDGFIIREAKGDDGPGGKSIMGYNIWDNMGGGIAMRNASLKLTNIVICGNISNSGSGISAESSECILTNATIFGNWAYSVGGAIFHRASSSTLTNVSISGNYALTGGSIYSISQSNLRLHNTIIYGNSSAAESSNSTMTAMYSLIEGLNSSATGNIAGTTDPFFLNSPSYGSAPFTTGNYRLQAKSPVINRGSNSFYDIGAIPDLNDLTHDLSCGHRILGDTLDMGAYEFDKTISDCPAFRNIYVDSAVITSGNGQSWATAFKTLGEGLYLASLCSQIDSILVAKGTYFPDRRVDAPGFVTKDDRNNTFLLPANIKIAGGYATGGGVRNWMLYPAILSGNIGLSGQSSDNAYHVVVSLGPVGSTVLSGFNIIGGNANQPYTLKVNAKNLSTAVGAGIYCYESSPCLTDLKIQFNEAANNYQSGGGIMNVLSSPEITNVFISGNSAIYGAGIANYNASNPIITNVLISGNRGYYGAGIYNSASSPVLTNATITGNNALNEGGGAMTNQSCINIKIRNSIIYGNSSGISNPNTEESQIFIRNSLVQGRQTDEAYGNLNGTIDPLFVQMPSYSSAPFSGGNFALQEASIAINKGDNILYAVTLIPDISLISFDINRNTRILEGNIDLGAFEYGAGTFCGGIKDALFVDSSKTVSGDGKSWLGAFKTLGEALYLARQCGIVDSILVAKGTYYPDREMTAQGVVSYNNRNNGFVLLKNVKLSGGYPPGGGERNWRLNTTVLSGNIGNAGTSEDNAYHVILSPETAENSGLNGFTIEGGKANSIENMLVDSVTIAGKCGGGIVNNSSSLEIKNTIVRNNSAQEKGGGIYDGFSSKLLMTNCAVAGNLAAKGGGICNDTLSSLIITNTVISGNKATITGGAVCSDSANLILTNVTISQNVALTGAALASERSVYKLRNALIYNNSTNNYKLNASESISYSLVQGMEGDIANNNLAGNINPLFLSPSGVTVPFTGGDYSLQTGSPAINKGSTAFYNTGMLPDLSSIQTDFAGNTRIADSRIDMGAYEFQHVEPCSGLSYNLYVDSSNQQSGNGSSWLTAFNTLGAALQAAKLCPNVDSILVAKGTYTPDRRADAQHIITSGDRNNSFVMITRAKIIGGYPSGGGIRQLSSNKTVLSGDPTGLKRKEYYSYHVVIAAGTIDSALLDGFTIENSNASSLNNLVVNDQIIAGAVGGGIYLVSSSPQLNNLVIRQNIAISGGGLYLTNSSPVLKNITIMENTALVGNGGGTFITKKASPRFENVHILYNKAPAGSGGGMYNSDFSAAVIVNSVFEGNTAETSAGGAIANDHAAPFLANVMIRGNSAIFGGGIYNSNSSPVLTNMLLSGNAAGLNGGGIYNMSSSAVITNATIAGNRAVNGTGGAMYNAVSSNVSIRNSVVYGNSSGLVNDASTPSISYSLVQDSTGNTNGNIYTKTPGFKNQVSYLSAPTKSGDYSLHYWSSLIDKGNTALFDADKLPDISNINTDILGFRRIFGGLVDIGAFEYYIFFSANDSSACSGDDFSFAANYQGDTTNIIYQWQVATDTVFLNISDDTTYSGTHSSQLHITHPQGLWQGYKYRCKIKPTLLNEVQYSEVYTIRFSNKWGSTKNTAWENPENWSCGKIPDEYVDVLINAGTVIVGKDSSCHSLKLSPGVSFTVMPGVIFSIIQ